MKDAGESLLILDSGNLLFRAPKIRQNQEGEAKLRAALIAKAFSVMGCDGFNVGLYDLAIGKDFLLETQKVAGFPFLSANMVHKNTGRPVFEPYTIKEINGIKIGIFGLITDQVRLDQRLSDIQVVEPIEAARKVVAELKKSKCHLIIGLTELGHQEDLRLAEQVTGLNFIVDGSRKGFPFRQTENKPTKVNDTVIFQAYNRGRHLGRLDLFIVDNSLKFANYSEKLNILSELEDIQERIKLFAEELGSSSSDVKKTKKASKSLGKAKKYLREVQGTSHYTNTKAILDHSIKENPNIKAMVKQYKEDAARMRR